MSMVGRVILLAWVHCILPKSDQEIETLSNLLIGLVRYYDANYKKIGEMVRTLATQKLVGDWTEPFVRLLAALPPAVDSQMEEQISRFQDNLLRVPSGSNLRVPPSLQAELAIPLLLSLMLCRTNVERIAGGPLSQTSPSRFSYISVPWDVPSYRTVDISSMLQSKRPSGLETGPATDYPEPAAGGADLAVSSSEVRKMRRWPPAFLIGVGLIFCGLALILLIQLWPKSVVSTPNDRTVCHGKLYARSKWNCGCPITPSSTAVPSFTVPVSSSVPTNTPQPSANATSTPRPSLSSPCGSGDPNQLWHTVTQGESWYSIARRYGLAMRQTM